MATFYGTLTRIREVNGEKVFTVRDYEKKDTLLDVALPPNSFCPARVDDIIYGICIPGENINYSVQMVGNNYIRSLPIVEISVVKEHVKKSILLSLIKTRVSDYLVDQVYKFFESETVKRISSDLKIARLDNHDAQVAETITVFAEDAKLDLDGSINNLVQVGMDRNQAHKFITWWRSKFTLRRLYLLGLTKTEIREANERGWEPSDLYRQLTINPYLIEKVSYDTARNIAQRYFLRLPPEYDLCGQIIRFIDYECEGHGNSLGKGWTAYPMYGLKRRFPELLQLQNTLVDVFHCRIRYNFLYLRHQAETEDLLTDYLCYEGPPIIQTPINEETRNKLNSEQRAAIEMALNNQISIITGPGGTGKTTTISTLCDELDFRGLTYYATAFTGKAVSRLRQVLKWKDKCTTLHMLRRTYKDEVLHYLIVDEASQVSNWLLASVLSKIGKKIRVVLVGDYRQLPAFNGDLFNQIINCEKIPKTFLTIDCRREKKDGPLFKNMQYLSTGHPEKFEWGEDCQFIEGDIPEVLSLVQSIYQTKSHKDITIICPYNEICKQLNSYLQNIYLPNATSVQDSFGNLWKVGARVMMLDNRHDIDIMNGEEGEITKLGPGEVEVVFQNHEPVKIPTFTPIQENNDSELFERPLSTEHITLSWSLTTDKSQGSQWSDVIYYIPGDQNISFNHKKRTYTSLSRASVNLYVVCRNEYIFRQMLITEPPVKYDHITNRLLKIPFHDRYT